MFWSLGIKNGMINIKISKYRNLQCLTGRMSDKINLFSYSQKLHAFISTHENQHPFSFVSGGYRAYTSPNGNQSLIDLAILSDVSQLIECNNMPPLIILLLS